MASAERAALRDRPSEAYRVSWSGFRSTGKLRDAIKALDNVDRSLKSALENNLQPEAFYVDPKRGMNGLKQVFGLDKPPRRIEGMDIAHLQGGETVASLVQFIDGLPFKQGYKRFRIKSVEGVDDYASMREIVSRRFRRLQQDGEPFPDILLIDGGKGQLNAVMETFAALEIKPPFTISLAKQQEEVFLPGESESYKLSRHSFGLRLLQFVRDEAHRFAQHYHHLLRRKSQFE